MLSRLQRLSIKADGRYARDGELQFIEDYVRSWSNRVFAYDQLRESTPDLVEMVYERLLKQNPQFFQRGGQDYTSKWRTDTLRVMRFAAMAMLYDDVELYKEKFLYWFQTLMMAFASQDNCNQTYALMQEVVREKLPTPVSTLFCPVLEETRSILGQIPTRDKNFA
jgi:hypothetical protein